MENRLGSLRDIAIRLYALRDNQGWLNSRDVNHEWLNRSSTLDELNLAIKAFDEHVDAHISFPDVDSRNEFNDIHHELISSTELFTFEEGFRFGARLIFDLLSGDERE
jgi:hypothetical protein